MEKLHGISYDNNKLRRTVVCYDDDIKMSICCVGGGLGDKQKGLSNDVILNV